MEKINQQTRKTSKLQFLSLFLKSDKFYFLPPLKIKTGNVSSKINVFVPFAIKYAFFSLKKEQFGLLLKLWPKKNNHR